tara:strand:+ start:103 stop:600 length:498 start_codon:yes stop_codon:yes gene_type:complete
MKVETLVKCALLLGAVVVLGLMVNRYNLRNKLLEESFDEEDVVDMDNVTGSNESVQVNETPATVTEKPTEKQPVQCYPRDTLSAADLLPRDAANSPFAQVNPSGQGDADGQNFLTAGSLIGIDTVGQSLRNANQQLRSEPPNPQVKVSPWMQTTINPDLSRKSLD